ncbi:uncharacterized protein LOC143859026 [Tasmannia lanceolata]|uniref:uncharacterized protein LOC143859026 n=1 Tax=Tasmannia lanceolata TaxID=3420 RepID=UPI004062DB92
MADAIINILLRNLNSLIQNELQLLGDVKDDVEELQRILPMIRDILPNAEAMAVKNGQLKGWLSNLTDAGYDADDILTDWAVEAQRLRSIGCGNIQVSNTFLPCIQFQRHKIATRTKKILKRLQKITEDRERFKLDVTTTTPESQERTPTMSLVNELQVYGRDEDKEKIVKLLLTDAGNEDDVQVIAIVGKGGLGKTTLAKLAYNHESVKDHFMLRMWIHVSQDFDVTRIVKAILESATGSPTALTQLDGMQKSLREIICEKRFLLVLDDVWNEDREKWDSLKQILTCCKGSKIIVTTRNQTIASMMGALHESLHLTGLSDSDCWSLFESQAFVSGRSEEHPNLVAIGEEIVKKCRGVPLAAKALGSLLRLKREEASWLSVRDSDTWELQGDELLPALRLSYTNLPSHLRQCFSFCALFPKGFTIEKEELILLWMANGFVTPNGRMELEDIGNEIFNDLLWRSFFQDIEKDYCRNITSCKMHDFVKDLAQSIIGNKCHIMDSAETKNIPPSTQYFYSNYLLLLNYQRLYEAKTIRTILFGRGCFYEAKTIKGLGYLRCLDVRRWERTWIPDSICNLKQLRYLNLSYSVYIETLPESIANLQNLQTLKLRECGNLRNLPKDMRKMSSLRHVDTYGCRSLTCVPIGIGQLSCLQTLSIFIVGYEENYQLKNLAVGDVEMQEKVLEGLEPHCNLKDLRIKGYNGIRFPGWIQNSLLTNLVNVSLNNCWRCENLPPLGQLPSLKNLEISGMSALKQINNEFYGNNTLNGFSFPSLKRLSLCDMDNLEMWAVEEGGVFPCLDGLRIECCTKLITLPCFLHLTSLHIDHLDEMSSFPESFLRDGNALQRLEISDCYKLRSLPRELDNFVALKGLRNVTSLEKLGIKWCENLASLPEEGVLRGLKSLQSLVIGGCKKLVSLPDDLRYLTALKNLKIDCCDDLASSLDGGRLKSLQSLEISNCDELASLPDGLQHVTTLQHLSIEGCRRMVNLPEWVEKLTSLQSLTIDHNGNMAGAIVTILLRNLNSLIQNEVDLLGGVKDDLEELKKQLGLIGDIIPNAEEMAMNGQLKGWLSNLMDAAYDADDILSDWAVEAQGLHSIGFGNIQVSNSFLPSFQFQRHKIATRTKTILTRIQNIVQDRNTFKLDVTTTSPESQERTHTVSDVHESVSDVNELEVYGRDKDKEEIVWLLQADVNNNENEVPVIALVGMAESATGTKTDVTQLEEMRKKLQNIICEKRFLLVLDDVWNEDEGAWEKRNQILKCNVKGSKIIVTTRKETVASMMGGLHGSLLHLTGLSFSDCWSLFERQAFGSGRSEEPQNLVPIGEQIVEKCGGVPLAAKALGRLLCGKQEARWEWVRDIAKCMIWFTILQSVIGNKCHIVDREKIVDIPTSTRYVYSHLPSLLKEQRLYKAKTIRTILLGHVCYNFVPSNIKKLRYLRCLDLSHINVDEIPHSICNLKQLRYLNLSDNYRIETLPESITKLQNLQALKLRDCDNLRNLPRDMRKMRSLRHVDAYGVRSLTCVPIGIGELSCLQMLSIFIVGDEEGRRLSELSNLKLRGELSIKQLNLVRNASDAKQANLKSKKDLRELELSWGDDDGDVEMHEEVSEGLEPHGNLKYLWIRDYEGIRFPGWIHNSLLTNLVNVSLSNCRRCENLPPLGQLPSLKSLTIHGMRAVLWLRLGVEFSDRDFCSAHVGSCMFLEVVVCSWDRGLLFDFCFYFHSCTKPLFYLIVVFL